MRRCRYVFVLLMLLGVAGVASAQPPKDLATLFPKDTLAYYETNKVGQFFHEFRDLFRGSVLYNVPHSMAKLQLKYQKKVRPEQMFSMSAMSMMGIAFSPELAREMARMKGFAAGLTRFEKMDEPEYLAVFQPGGSTLYPMYFRMFMSMGQPREKVHGTYLYQFPYEMFNPQFGPNGEQLQQPTPKWMPAFAHTNGLFMVGTTKALKDVIGRLKGKEKAASLADNKTFQEVKKKLGNQPGYQFFVDAEALATRTPLMQFVKQEPQAAALVELINPKAFRAWGVGLSLEKGTLAYQELALLNPDQKSPVLELLPQKAFSADLLNYAPRDAVLVAGFANDNGGKRWEKILTLIEKAMPKGNVREMLKQLEKQMDVSLRDDVCGQVKQVAFVVGNLLKAPVRRIETKGQNFTEVRTEPEVPMFLLLQATNKEAAAKLARQIPKFAQLGASEIVKPMTRKIKGHAITSIQMKPTYSLHYVQHGDTVLIGPYMGPLVRALNSASNKKGLMADDKTAAQVKEHANSPLLFMVRPVAALSAFFMISISEHGRATTYDKKPSEARPDEFDKKKDCAPEEGGKGKGKRPLPKLTITKAKEDPEIREMKKVLQKVLNSERFLVLGMSRGEDYVQVHGHTANMRPVVSQMTNVLVEQFFKQMIRAQDQLKKALEEEKKARDAFEKERRKQQQLNKEIDQLRKEKNRLREQVEREIERLEKEKSRAREQTLRQRRQLPPARVLKR